MRNLLLPCLLVSLLSGLAGCRHSGAPATPMVQVDDPVSQDASSHAVHNRELKSVMLELSLSTTSHLPQELEAEKETRLRRATLVQALQRMESSVGEIPKVLEGVSLSEADRQDFLDRVNRFRQDIQQLSEDANQLDGVAMEEKFHGLQLHCAGCHSRYRVLPRIDF